MNELQKYKVKLSQTITAINNEKGRLEDAIKIRKIAEKDNKDADKKLREILLDTKKSSKKQTKMNADIKDLIEEYSKQDKILLAVKKNVKKEQADTAKVMQVLLKDIAALEIEKEKKEEALRKRFWSLEKDINTIAHEKKVLLKANKTISEGNVMLESKKAELDLTIEKNGKIIKANIEKIEKNTIALDKYNDDAKKLEDREKNISDKIVCNMKKLNITNSDIEQAENNLNKILNKNKKLEGEKFALSRKAEYLSEQETYISAEFKRAGIKYEPYQVESYEEQN